MTTATLPGTPDFEIYPITHVIASARLETDAVVVDWSDGQHSKHDVMSLRENSPDDETIHPASRELVVDPLTFPEKLVTEPILFTVAKEFDVVPNIRRAKVSATLGEIVLELSGEDNALERAVARLEELGVEVESVSGDIVAG